MSSPVATPTPTVLPVQPLNGTIVTSNGLAGLGQFTIRNGTDLDALVKLAVPGGETVRSFYVVHQSDWTIADVPPGEYALMFTTGSAWDPVLLRFQLDRSYTAFDNTLAFTEVKDAGGTTHSSWEVTIHSPEGGDADTRLIDESEFGPP